MADETEVIVLSEAAIAAIDTENLTELLAQKTNHLLVACRCKLPDHLVISMRNEVKMLQAVIMRRVKEKSHENGHPPTQGH